MAKEYTKQVKINPLQQIDTNQLEYISKNTLLYGSLVASLITLGVTYIYLLVQKIKN